MSSAEAAEPLTAVTICLVPAAHSGPFVFHGELSEGCAAAAELGFTGVEVFADGAPQLKQCGLAAELPRHGLRLSALGTGAGWLVHRLCLIDRDPERRRKALAYILEIIDCAGELGAPAILGSMQGRVEDGLSRSEARNWLAEALVVCGRRAAEHGQVFLYEPLNRYETNLFNRQEEAASALKQAGCQSVKLLCDLFHMNLEEADVSITLRSLGDAIGHVHWADSNRLAMGWGHTSAESVATALQSVGYRGWLSAEIFPLPDASAAARQSLSSMQYAWRTARRHPVLRNPR